VRTETAAVKATSTAMRRLLLGLRSVVLFGESTARARDAGLGNGAEMEGQAMSVIGAVMYNGRQQHFFEV